MTVKQHVADVLELTDVLRERFGQEKIYLLGHSWGAQLGLFVAQAAPENYHALVTTGQYLAKDVTAICERFIRSSLKTSEFKESILAEWQADKAGVEDDFRNGLCSNNLVAPLGGELYGETSGAGEVFGSVIGSAPEYRPQDLETFGRNYASEQREALFKDAKAHDVNITKLELPVYFFLGRHDYVTPSEAVPAYVEQLQAPHEEIVWFENSAHFAFIEEPETFARELVRVKNEVQAAETSR